MTRAFRLDSSQSSTRRHLIRSIGRFELLESRTLLAAQPVISEFMASNRDALLDGSEPPDSPDWIEIFNAGDESLNLEGWYLTDDPGQLTRWRFPDTELPPDGYLVVFASGAASPDPAGNLHVGFRLRAAGEYLALVRPDGRTIASQFGSAGSEYPPQVPDVSYGLVMQPTTTEVISHGASARVLIPTSDIAAGWRGGDPDFDDDPATTEWFAAQTAVGFGGSDAQRMITASDIGPEMRTVNSSALIRIPFDVADLATIDAMTLDVAYDDGFVAFLNGRQIAQSNSPPAANFQSRATNVHDAIGGVFTPRAGAISILYDFENDGGQSVTDKLDRDGQQNPIFYSGGSVDTNESRAAFGTRSLRVPDSPGAPNFNRLRLPGTASLSEQFTLAAHVNLSANDFQRVFSNYQGTGPLGDSRLVFDVDPSGTQISGLRVAIGHRGVLQTDVVPPQLSEPGYHHLALAYDDGEIQVYVDGQVTLVGTLGDGPLNMLLDLSLGEDPHDGGGSANEQLSANVDDLLVLTADALSQGDIRLLAREGAEALFSSGGREQLMESFEVSQHLDLLRHGENILAVQGLNITSNDSDFFILPRLTATDEADGQPPAYFPEPTPGAINRMPIDGLVADPSFSVERGFYSDPLTTVITVETLGATIIYTTDGSEPTLENGIQISALDPATPPVARIPIETTTTLHVAGYRKESWPSAVHSQTYLFLDDVIRQPGSIAGLPTRWGPTRADYAMDPNVVDAAPYSQTIIDDLKSVPTVSLTLSSDDFFGPDGIYSNTQSRGREWERSVSVEYLDPLGEQGFQVNAGLRVHGGFSRDPSASPQHSLRLHFRSEYGPAKLDYPLFHNSPVTQFDSLVLNAQSSDNWTSINLTTGHVAQFLRDQWAQDMQREMGHVHVPGKYVHLYINGLYWGLYDLMERPDDDFAAAHFGGVKEEYDVIVDNNASRGNLTAWNELLRRARARDFEATSQLLNVDNFIDYMILNIYMGNWDWPDHNWNAVRRRGEGEKFKFLVWDAEVGLGLDVNVPGPIRPRTLDVDLAGRRRDVSPASLAGGPGEIYDRLRSDREFQLRFADRLNKHLFNDGALTADRAADVYATRAAEIESALVAEAARWGDVRRRPPDVPDGTWLEEKNWILDTFFPLRGEIVLADFADEQLYPLIAAPSFNQHGGPTAVGFELTMTHANPNGAILYTLDGTDPRQTGGAVSAAAMNYAGSISLTEQTNVKARVFDNGTWSALNEADFAVPSADFNVDGVVNEADIDLQCHGIQSQGDVFDLTADGTVDGKDLAALIETVLGTSAGDANLDGVFDSADLVAVFQAGEYEDVGAGISTWSEGDWNCDLEFDSGDLVAAFQAGRYVAASPRHGIAALHRIAAALVDRDSVHARQDHDRARMAQQHVVASSARARPADVEMQSRDQIFASLGRDD